jgi:hypothetical protein
MIDEFAVAAGALRSWSEMLGVLLAFFSTRAAAGGGGHGGHSCVTRLVEGSARPAGVSGGVGGRVPPTQAGIGPVFLPVLWPENGRVRNLRSGPAGG